MTSTFPPATEGPGGRNATRFPATVLEQLWFGDEDPVHGVEEASRSFAAVLGRALRLRAFPGAAATTLKLLGDPESTVGQIAAALGRDLALSGRLLAVANSALFASGAPCGGVPDALIRLGYRATGQLVLGVAALGMFDDELGVATVMRDHVVGVAVMSRLLATDWGHSDPDAVFVAGLLSDVGKLFAHAAAEVSYHTLPESVLEAPDMVHTLERMWAGWDHAVLGGHLLSAWNLPDDLAQVVAWHHQPARAFAAGGNIGLTVALLRIADAIEYQLRKRPEMEPEFVSTLAASGDASYASLSEERLATLWSRLAEARQVAVRAACHLRQR